jgi:SAM-dependent methyltransferase
LNGTILGILSYDATQGQPDSDVPQIPLEIGPNVRDFTVDSLLQSLPMPPLVDQFARLIRAWRWKRRGWSASSDRAFHESLFRVRQYDPFTFAYPGYITIRRFADLAEAFLPQAGLVVDLGCGPAEITCELAARRPDLRFAGIDHSPEAVDRARSNAKRLSLSNARFEVGDLEAYVPQGRIDLVVLFDSFHHLSDPRELVLRLSPQTSHLLLIEPRGNWAGGWQKDLDFDWLLRDLDHVRRRVDFLCGGDSHDARARPQPATPHPTETAQGAPVERRYTLDDLERLLDGWRLDIRGTVAGFEAYPPEAFRTGGSREDFGRFAYERIRAIDELLFERGRDLLAKHWVVHAELGAGRGSSRRPPPAAPGEAPPSEVSGPYDAAYLSYDGPADASAGDRIVATVRMKNCGWEAWNSRGDRPIFASYHWLDRAGRVLDFEGERTSLPRVVNPGDTCDVAVQIRVPDRAGRVVLAVDLVREQVTWFSQAGLPWMDVPFTVRRR